MTTRKRPIGGSIDATPVTQQEVRQVRCPVLVIAFLTFRKSFVVVDSVQPSSVTMRLLDNRRRYAQQLSVDPVRARHAGKPAELQRLHIARAGIGSRIGNALLTPDDSQAPTTDGMRPFCSCIMINHLLVAGG